MSQFLQYFKEAPNLLVYKFGASIPVPSTLQFPAAKTVTVINCTREGVFKILTPNTFPTVKEIHYISTHPGQMDVYKRFPPSVQWVFPDKSYAFYDMIVGMKKGYKDPQLINRYLFNKRIVDNDSPFDVSYEFDLKLPDFGIVNGDVYRQEFEAYCHEKAKELLDQELF